MLLTSPINSTQVLFTIEEALTRAGASKGSGCLLVFNPQESIHIFVDDGDVISIEGNNEKEEDSLKRALALTEAAYRWIPDAEPTQRSASIGIGDFLANHAAREERAGKTIKMAVYERSEKKTAFEYYFIPEEAPATRFRIKKVSTVVGREPSCDFYIKSFQVSRRHCLLQATERGLLVKDLDSTNGTFLNGIPLADGYVGDGDRLGLGTYVMTLKRERIQEKTR